MLYWICPECGHECSPAVRECPTCTAPPAATTPSAQSAPQQSVQSHELLSLAQNFEPAPSVAAPALRQSTFSTNGRETFATNTALAVEEEDITQEIELAPPLSQRLAPLGQLDFQPARPSRFAPVKLPILPLPLPISAPELRADVPIALPQNNLEAAGPAVVGEVDFQAAQAHASAVMAPSTQPLPSRRQSVAFLRVGSLEVASDGIALAKVAPLARPVPRSNTEQANGHLKPIPGEIGVPSLLGSGLGMAGPSLGARLNDLKTSAEEEDRVGIESIQRSFSEKPAVALLAEPAEVISAPAPAGTQFLQTEKPKFFPAEPESRGRASAVAGPQAPTLAGPSLPPQLLNLNHRPRFRARRRQWSLWPLSVIIITLVILGMVSGLQYLTQDRDTRAASAAPPAQTQTVVKPALIARAPVIEEHPAARSVEVAGIRIVNGPNKRPQLQFIVINHSAAEITGLNIRIAVRSVDSPADAPLLTVSSPIAVLGPNQSKEIHAEVNTPIQASQVPDWQSLRTDVLIGRQ